MLAFVERLIVGVKLMRTSLTQMQQMNNATSAQVNGVTLHENEQMNTSVEFADEFGLTKHEIKQAKKKLGRSVKI